MKKGTVLRNTLTSIGTAAVIFCIIGVIFDQIYQGNFTLEHYSFTRMVLGTLVIGLGFGLPTVVYEQDRLSVAVQTLIHMAIGCVVMTAVAFAVGWISVEAGPFTVAVTILGEIAVAFVIWFFYYLHMKKLAKEMNHKFEQMK